MSGRSDDSSAWAALPEHLRDYERAKHSAAHKIQDTRRRLDTVAQPSIDVTYVALVGYLDMTTFAFFASAALAANDPA